MKVIRCQKCKILLRDVLRMWDEEHRLRGLCAQDFPRNSAERGEWGYRSAAGVRDQSVSVYALSAFAFLECRGLNGDGYLDTHQWVCDEVSAMPETTDAGVILARCEELDKQHVAYLEKMVELASQVRETQAEVRRLARLMEMEVFERKKRATEPL